MFITSFFTQNGVPKTGLSPTIRVRNVSTDALEVTDAAMAEVGDGWYKYDFATFDPTEEYAIRCDGGATLNNVERYTSAGTSSDSKETIATEVWDTDLATHTTAGTSGEAVGLLDGIDFQTDQLTFTGLNVNAQVAGINDIDFSPTQRVSIFEEDKEAMNAAVPAVPFADSLYDRIEEIKTQTTGIPTAGDVAGAVWDESLATHTTAGTAGATVGKLVAMETDLTLIKKVETGRWKIINNQMIFYDDDGVSILLTFDLFNYDGLPANIDIFERNPA